MELLRPPEALWAEASSHDLVVVATGTAAHAKLTLAAVSARHAAGGRIHT